MQQSDIRELTIVTRRTARYHQIGEPSEATDELWLVLHGYAQQSEHFIRAFRSLDDGTRVIVAPEGLSRFYVSGTDGHVGASWMTKVDRLAEIDDYIAYLDALAGALFATLDRSRVRLVVLGFSQGVATAARWASRGGFAPDATLLWGSHLPPDVEPDRARLGAVRIVTGTRDEYRREGALERDVERLGHAGVDAELIEFDGAHRIESEPLLHVAEWLRERASSARES